MEKNILVIDDTRKWNMTDVELTEQEVWLRPSSSPYSFKEKLRMLIWWSLESVLFKTSSHKMNAWRCFMLRKFGARIGKGNFIDPQARIWFPWNLEMGDNSGIGFDVLIYNLDKVTIGNFVTIAPKCVINTASHDHSDENFKLITKPVVLESGVFVGLDSYISPGVIVHKMAVIGARSVVVKDLPANMVCVGHPCRPIKERVMRKA